MGYTFTKVTGRGIAIFKDGEFDHQQFRSHWAYREPQRYVEHLAKLDREAAEWAREWQERRRAEVDAYLERRRARVSRQMELGL